jgi:hypothetical protein
MFFKRDQIFRDYCYDLVSKNATTNSIVMETKTQEIILSYDIFT